MSQSDRTVTNEIVALPSRSRRRFIQGAATALAAAPLFLSLAAFAQQAVRPAPGMPAPRSIRTNGIRMAVYGQDARGYGRAGAIMASPPRGDGVIY